MPRVDPLQPAFNAGEFGPRMVARVDFAKYRNAARKFENLIALAQGGAVFAAFQRHLGGAKCRLQGEQSRSLGI